MKRLTIALLSLAAVLVALLAWERSRSAALRRENAELRAEVGTLREQAESDQRYAEDLEIEIERMRRFDEIRHEVIFEHFMTSPEHAPKE